MEIALFIQNIQEERAEVLKVFHHFPLRKVKKSAHQTRSSELIKIHHCLHPSSSCSLCQKLYSVVGLVLPRGEEQISVPIAV